MRLEGITPDTLCYPAFFPVFFNFLSKFGEHVVGGNIRLQTVNLKLMSDSSSYIKTDKNTYLSCVARVIAKANYETSSSILIPRFAGMGYTLSKREKSNGRYDVEVSP